MDTSRILLYVGSESDSEARVCLRQLPVSPRTWIYASTSQAYRLRELLLSFGLSNSWQSSPFLFCHQHIRIFSQWDRLLSGFQTRSCDCLLVYGWAVDTFREHLQELRCILRFREQKNFRLDLFLLASTSEQADEFDSSIFVEEASHEGATRFWVPTQNQDLLCRHLSRSTFHSLFI